MISNIVSRTIEDKTYTWSKLKRHQIAELMQKWSQSEILIQSTILKESGYDKDQIKDQLNLFQQKSQQLQFAWDCVSKFKYAFDIFVLGFKASNPNATDEEIEAIPLSVDEVILIALEIFGFKLKDVE